MRDRVRGIAVGGLIAASAGIGSAAGSEPDPLAAYRWTSRVLLVSAPDADDPAVGAQRDALASAGAEIAERDLVVVEALGRAPRSDALRRRFHLPDARFAAVLVGKDGGAKLASETPIPPRLLFSTIDAMPMRRDEARKRSRVP